MSTLTRVDSTNGKKPHYKDYVAFLGNYRNGKKDEVNSVTTTDSGVSFSLTSSSNNSSSSISSDLNGFHEDTERFNNQKFNAIRTGFSKNSVVTEEPRKTVKSEIVIEIKDPGPTSFQQINKVFQINNNGISENSHKVSYPQQNKSNVSQVSKKFEDRRESNSSVKSNVITGCHIPKQAIGKKNSIGEISKKFEQNNESNTVKNGGTSFEVNKKAASINEVSKIFQNNTTLNITTKSTKVFNNTPKPFILENVVNSATVKPVGYTAKMSCTSPKPLITSPKPTNIPPRPTFDEIVSAGTLRNNPTAEVPKVYSKHEAEVPKIYTNDVHIIPEVTKAYSNSFATPTKHSDPVGVPTPPPLPSVLPKETNIIPPPPPFPIVDHTVSKPSHAKLVVQNNDKNKIKNGVKITLQENGHDSIDGKTGADLKSDPRLKRAVYGALREMYGSYHDKANDYIATLPKNRVRKNNGLDSIINSIASQGGLDKLNGRANPDPETV